MIVILSKLCASFAGKTEVVAHLKTLEGHASVVMIGDGATDMEARPPADLFIGFGGNKIREKVTGLLPPATC